MSTERRRSLLLLARRIPLLLAAVIAGAAAGYVSLPAQGGYSSTAVLFVGSPGATPDVFYNAQTLQGQQLLAGTFAAMVDTSSVAQAAVSSSKVDRSPGTVLAETSAAVVTGTSLIKVTVTDHDPYTARRLADAVAASAVARIGSLDPVKTGAASDSPLMVSQPAALNLARPPRPVQRHVAEGALFGLVAALALVLLVDYTLRRPEREAAPLPAAPAPAAPAAVSGQA